MIGTSAAHWQMKNEIICLETVKKMHRCSVYQNVYPHIGYIFFCVFGRSVIVSCTRITQCCLQDPDWLLLFSESMGWKRITSNEDSKY